MIHINTTEILSSEVALSQSMYSEIDDLFTVYLAEGRDSSFN